jgi:hypothetical protein
MRGAHLSATFSSRRAHLSAPSSHLAAMSWPKTHVASSRRRVCGDKDPRPDQGGPAPPCPKHPRSRPQLAVPCLNPSQSTTVISSVVSQQLPRAERRCCAATGHASRHLLFADSLDRRRLPTRSHRSPPRSTSKPPVCSHRLSHASVRTPSSRATPSSIRWTAPPPSHFLFSYSKPSTHIFFFLIASSV